MNKRLPKCVIVVDDDPLDCTIVEKIVQRKLDPATEVKCFIHGHAALEFLREQPTSGDNEITLMFVDVQMPVMNGFEFIEQLEGLPAATVDNLRIYILSSSANLGDRDRAVQNGRILRFIQKPLTTRVVEEIIAAL